MGDQIGTHHYGSIRGLMERSFYWAPERLGPVIGLSVPLRGSGDLVFCDQYQDDGSISNCAEVADRFQIRQQALVALLRGKEAFLGHFRQELAPAGPFRTFRSRFRYLYRLGPDPHAIPPSCDAAPARCCPRDVPLERGSRCRPARCSVRAMLTMPPLGRCRPWALPPLGVAALRVAAFARCRPCALPPLRVATSRVAALARCCLPRCRYHASPPSCVAVLVRWRPCALPPRAMFR